MTAEGLRDRRSVCVIGAGAIGLAAALQLARRGVGEISVLESRHIAAGSSGRSAGIVETQYLDRLDIELRVRSMQGFDELEREHGLLIVRNGYLRLAHSAETAQEFERSVEIQRELGVLDARVLEREQITRLVPDMRVEDVAVGLFGQNDGFLDGYLYCGLLAELARAAGARLLVGHTLLGGEPRAGGGLRLRTSMGAIVDCDLAVNAAGAWAGSVAAMLGYELELTPQRQQAAVVGLARELPYTMPSVMDYTPASGEPGLYFRHDRPGQLIAGLHSEEPFEPASDPDGYSQQLDDQFVELLAHKLPERLPPLAQGLTLDGGWAGLYPISPTRRPLLGPIVPGAPLIVAAGAGGSGIQLAPVLGELVADWALHGEPRAVPGASVLVPSAYPA